MYVCMCIECTRPHIAGARIECTRPHIAGAHIECTHPHMAGVAALELSVKVLSPVALAMWLVNLGYVLM